MSQSFPSRQQRNVMIWLLLLLALIGGAWYLLSASGGESQPEPMRRGWGGQATSVRVVPAELGSLNVRLHSIGTVTALNTVVVRSRVAGVLDEVLFAEGAMVAAGDTLAQIDPAPFEAQLAQAEGQLLQNRAQLENAEVDLKLYQGLYDEDSIARQQLDSQAALVRQLRGAQKTGQAEVDDARLQLSWTTIKAPIAGRLGLRRVDAGNLIAANEEEGLVTITQTQPIAVFFTVPEVQVGALRRAMAEASSPLVVEALSRDEQEVMASGILQSLDNQIDTATGTLRIKAVFANSDEVLFPNQFVNVRLRLAQIDDVLTIPTDAVQHGSQGDYVYVVEDGSAFLRTVELGASDADRVAVTHGLQAGAQVVLEGLDRLRDGRAVVVEGQEAAASAPVDGAAPVQRGEGLLSEGLRGERQRGEGKVGAGQSGQGMPRPPRDGNGPGQRSAQG